MFPLPIGIALAVACCVLACGDRPDLPGPATPTGTGSANGSLQENEGGSGGRITMLGDQPILPEPSPGGAAPSLFDAGTAAAVPGVADGVPPSAAGPLLPGATVLACTEVRQGCLALFIAVADEEAESCIQLTLDDCGDTTRPGLSVDVPLAWRFGSGFVATLGSSCLPQARFVANNATIVSASGSISWNEDTRQPSELVIDVTLQPSSSEAGTPAPISITSSDLVEPLLECDDS
jgi:hypothetical protein